MKLALGLFVVFVVVPLFIVELCGGNARHECLVMPVKGSEMPVNVNCTSYSNNGNCLHQAAPRRWFGPASCIVLPENTNQDPRKPHGCALCTPHTNPHGPYIPQPNTLSGTEAKQRHPGTHEA